MRTHRNDRLGWAWCAVAAVAMADFLWAWRIGFGFHGFVTAFCIVGSLAGLGLLYSYSGRNESFRDLGHYYALWMAYPLAWNIFTYLAATLRFPLCDGELSAIDSSLGFQWYDWALTIHAHPLLYRVLFLTYDSIFIQGFAFVAFFALTNNRERNRELLWITMLAGLVTVTISGFIPALGPQTRHVLEWTKALLAVRAGALTSVTLRDMQGIVAFPSFHTVLAIAYIYANRPPSRTFVPIAALNSLMLMSIPVMGHHYFTDVIAGAAVTGLSIAVFRMATARERESGELAIASQPSLIGN